MERMRSPHTSIFRLAIAAWLVPALCAALVPAPSLGAAPAPLEGWTRLRYTTTKLLVFSGELTMQRTPAGDRTTVRTDSRATLLGAPFVDSWSVSSMDRKSGRPLDFLDVRPKKKAERYTFTDAGILHETLKPRKESPDDPLEKWRTSKKETLPAEPGSAPTAAPSPARPGAPAAMPVAAPPAPTATGTAKPAPAAADPHAAPGDPSRWVHDYISMIVRLHDLPLRKVGDEATVRVLTGKGAAPMRVRVSQERDVRRDLADLATGKKTSAIFHELRLRVTPLAGTSSDTKGFMNMEGETELWVDAATRTVMEISGEVPKVPGRVDIVLAGYKK